MGPTPMNDRASFALHVCCQLPYHARAITVMATALWGSPIFPYLIRPALSVMRPAFLFRGRRICPHTLQSHWWCESCGHLLPSRSTSSCRENSKPGVLRTDHEQKIHVGIAAVRSLPGLAAHLLHVRLLLYVASSMDQRRRAEHYLQRKPMPCHAMQRARGTMRGDTTRRQRQCHQEVRYAAGLAGECPCRGRGQGGGARTSPGPRLGRPSVCPVNLILSASSASGLH
jgi:hypothetical protein